MSNLDTSMYQPATYWPPGSWDSAGAGNVAVHLQAIWTFDDGEEKVYLQVDVAEQGFLYPGIIGVLNPLMLNRARRIDKFYSYPDIRSLKQVRYAIVSPVKIDEAA